VVKRQLNERYTLETMRKCIPSSGSLLAPLTLAYVEDIIAISRFRPTRLRLKCVKIRQTILNELVISTALASAAHGKRVVHCKT
jgi:hypothetical protein